MDQKPKKYNLTTVKNHVIISPMSVANCRASFPTSDKLDHTCNFRLDPSLCASCLLLRSINSVWVFAQGFRQLSPLLLSFAFTKSNSAKIFKRIIAFLPTITVDSTTLKLLKSTLRYFGESQSLVS